MLLRILLIGLSITSIAGAAQNVVVLLDDSGSMDAAMGSDRSVLKIDAAKRALLTVLERVPDDARVGVLALNGADGNGEWIIPLGPVDKTTIADKVQRIRAGGSTPLGRFMKTASDELLELRSKEHYGSYRLLIVTDGEASDQGTVDRYLPDILSRAINVDVIGVDMAGNHSLATRVNNYRRADDPAALTQAIEQSLAESNPDANDADEQADFELLAAWPDGLAMTAIETLSKTDDEPIGKAAVIYEPSFTPVSTLPSPPGPGQSEPGDQGRGSRMGKIAIGIALLLAILFGSLLKGIRRH